MGGASVGGKKGRDLAEHGQMGGGCRGPSVDGRAKLAEEQHSRRLTGVVGGLPVPDAGRIGAAEGALHGRAQSDRIDTATAFEIGDEQTRSLGDADGSVAVSGYEGERRHLDGPGRNTRHGRTSGERERIEPRGALSTPPAQTRRGHPLPLSWQSGHRSKLPTKKARRRGPGFRSDWTARTRDGRTRPQARALHQRWDAAAAPRLPAPAPAR